MSILIGSGGGGGGLLGRSRLGGGSIVDSSCSGMVPIWDSSDCAETARSFGGAVRSGGVGEFGWLIYEAVSDSYE